ncbi:hypothetical protein DFH07DRAFT_1029120 [Mycena maculata]|uniref:Uncharacterized protein n=1 Tax=Mycena maculata TaxID=230809 RepID=A0AAD7J0T9_9AGAR|nr:hypothetical protein DFH07DRAFT_1029120 [Mycena maculata]
MPLSAPLASTGALWAAAATHRLPTLQRHPSLLIDFRWCSDPSITIANKNFSQHSFIHETIRIKSGAWDDSGVFIYSTLNHVKDEGLINLCRIL